MAELNWQPPEGEVLDWGCGSGIAGRVFLERYGVVRPLRLWDRSRLAVGFAERRARKRFPSLDVQRSDPATAQFKTLLLSHVLTELDDGALEELLELAAKATSVVWVEPGTHETSRRLITIREKLRTSFGVVAPCTHQRVCPMLAGENSSHWCHHFATPPQASFTDGNWARFAALVGIDLRSLPLSYLVLDKRPVAETPSGATRIIGRPRVYKAHALLLGCGACGLREGRLSKRTLPEEFRRLRKGRAGSLELWKCSGEEIVQVDRRAAEELTKAEATTMSRQV